MFTFTKARPYAFFYEEAHLVLWQFDRDGRRDLYVLHEGDGDGAAVLEYPGATFTERVLAEIGDVFFISVPEESTVAVGALGAVFWHRGTRYGAYYNAEAEELPMIWFFRLEGEPGEVRVEPLSNGEHREISAVFVKRYGHLLDIRVEGSDVKGAEG